MLTIMRVVEACMKDAGAQAATSVSGSFSFKHNGMIPT